MGQDGPKIIEASLAHLAPLALLLEWVRSPLADSTLNINQIGKLKGYTPSALNWLVENEYVVKFHRGGGMFRPGPRRTKMATYPELIRARLGLKKPNLKPSTIRYYNSVLGIRYPEDLFKVNAKGLPAMFEGIFGLPNRVNATEFACTYSLPTAKVKEWFRDLVKSGRASIIAVRGKRMIVCRVETEP
jgi:hypothetical protein